MNGFEVNNIIDVLENGLGEAGDLCLTIYCTKCDANFELNHESVVMAIGMSIPFIEYVRYIQNSKCRICNKDENTHED